MRREEEDSVSGTEGSGRRRLLAIASLVLLGLMVIVVLVAVISNLGAVLIAIVGLATTALGGWWAITEQMPRRAVGLGLAVLGLLVIVGALAMGMQDTSNPGALALAVILLGAGAALCSRLAVQASLHEIDLDTMFPHLRPSHPVLICNPWSGGGKVARFDLVKKAEALGVEVILLDHGLDLEVLARDAVERGADCLGMAGGDGSQALVASIAIEHGLPFVCISAGTRNHFALDLGLDREDPSTGLVAFTEGVIRRIDYARVGSRLFVNNVSLGVYAQIVDQDSYRDAKLETTKESLPELLGRTAEPFDLQFTTPEGARGRRVVPDPRVQQPLHPGTEAGRLPTAIADHWQARGVRDQRPHRQGCRCAGRPVGDRPERRRTRTCHEFTTERFEVRSRSGTANAGVDGEALTLDTPLTFEIHPGGMTVLVPPDNPRVSATKHYRSFGVSGLWDLARGRDVGVPGLPE